MALGGGKDASEGVAIAVSELENSPLTNAGFGSNLSLTGQVECDASLMEGRGGFGSVGALQGYLASRQAFKITYDIVPHRIYIKAAYTFRKLFLKKFTCYSQL